MPPSDSAPAARPPPSPADAEAALAREAWTSWVGGAPRHDGDGSSRTLVDPASGREVARVRLAGEADVDAAVAAGAAALEGEWGRMPGHERARLLWRLADALDERAPELAALEVLENGLPAADATRMVAWAATVLREIGGWAGKITGETVDGGAERFAYTARHPLGVVAAIVPWNAPLGSFTFKIAPALAAGCAIVVKPSELTPLTALRVCELAHEVGLPAGALNVVAGPGGVTGRALASHPGVARMSFTGSTEVGRKIIEYSARNLARLNLELGGKSPNVICADADLDEAIPAAAWAIFAGAGQICTAGARVLVEEPVYEAVAAGIAEVARGAAVGPGFDPDSRIGPLISPDQLERVESYVEGAGSDGARVVIGGCRLGGERRGGGNFYAPTVVTDVDQEMRIAREEVFGPVVTVVPFADDRQAAELANASEYGLAGAVWTRDLSRAQRLARAIRVGMLWINTYGEWLPGLPHGPLKASGYGAKFGQRAVLDHTEERTVIARI